MQIYKHRIEPRNDEENNFRVDIPVFPSCQNWNT